MIPARWRRRDDKTEWEIQKATTQDDIVNKTYLEGRADTNIVCLVHHGVVNSIDQFLFIGCSRIRKKKMKMCLWAQTKSRKTNKWGKIRCWACILVGVATFSKLERQVSLELKWSPRYCSLWFEQQTWSRSKRSSREFQNESLVQNCLVKLNPIMPAKQADSYYWFQNQKDFAVFMQLQFLLEWKSLPPYVAIQTEKLKRNFCSFESSHCASVLKFTKYGTPYCWPFFHK